MSGGRRGQSKGKCETHDTHHSHSQELLAYPLLSIAVLQIVGGAVIPVEPDAY